MLEPAKTLPIKKRAKKNKTKQASIPAQDLFRDFNDKDRPGAIIVGARTKEGITQKELSVISGIPQGHISEMENGKRMIGKIIAKKLGDALNIGYKVFL